MQWTRGFWEAMQPYESEAADVNSLEATNLFRLNQTIKPMLTANQ